MKIKCDNPEAVAKEMMWLAWQACGGPLGMGVFQDHPGATKEEVWERVRGAGDYKFDKDQNPAKMMGTDKPGETRAHYVFGRMMKLSLKWDSEGVEIPDGKPKIEYQAWCGRYQTYQELAEAAISSVVGESAKSG